MTALRLVTCCRYGPRTRPSSDGGGGGGGAGAGVPPRMVLSFVRAPGGEFRYAAGDRTTWSSASPSSRSWNLTTCDPLCSKKIGAARPTYRLSCHPQPLRPQPGQSSRTMLVAVLEPMRQLGMPSADKASENCTQTESFE